MTVSALLAVRALTSAQADRRPVAVGSGRWVGWWTAFASTAGFLGLEAVDAVLVGEHAGRSGVSFVLAALVHGMAAVGAAVLGRTSVRVVLHRAHRPALPAMPVGDFPRAAESGRSPLLLTQHLCAPLGGRASPARA